MSNEVPATGIDFQLAHNFTPEVVREIRTPRDAARNVLINGKPFPWHIEEDGIRVISEPATGFTRVELTLIGESNVHVGDYSIPEGFDPKEESA